MHRCLYISETLKLIFEYFQVDEDDSGTYESQGKKKTLASLARTCRLFSSPALDILWCHLDSFDPLRNVFPTVPSLADATQWLTFHKYAKCVKTIHERGQALTSVRRAFLSSLQDCPPAYLPLLPNLTKIVWISHSFSPPDHGDSRMIQLLKYLGGSSVTTVNLLFYHGLDGFSVDLAIMAELPRLCPNVTTFTILLNSSWTDKVVQEVGRMTTQWSKLQTLRTPTIPQSFMDQLLVQGTLEALHIDYDASLPVFTGRIPETVRDFSLFVDHPLACARFFETVHANPTSLYLAVDMLHFDEDMEEEADEMFHILPRRLDTSRLLSLTIEPNHVDDLPMLKLQKSPASALAQFTALCELNLDSLCTAEMSDADYAYMAGSLIHLRHLKLGAENASLSRDDSEPEATIEAVIAILTSCEHLETFHIVFNGLIPPRGASTREDGTVELSEELARRGWGVSNRHITELHVGCSPLDDVNVHAMASCLKSIMPCLVQIKHTLEEGEEWEAVQNLLKSY